MTEFDIDTVSPGAMSLRRWRGVPAGVVTMIVAR